MTPRFEVDYKQRLEQRKNASNAVRLPRLGYELYRIYVIEETKKQPQGIKPGPINATTIGSKSHQHSMTQWQQVFWAFVDELESRMEPAYEVKWLKPKQTTLFRMRGHRVEPAQPGDTVGHVGPIDKPVRLGR